MTSTPGAGADPDDLHYPLTFNHTVSHDTTTTLPPPSITFLNSPLVVREVLAVVMGVVMVVGLGGNGLLCGMVFRKVTMRSAINLLVAQLAASDVLLTCWVMPLALADLFLPVTLTWGWWLCTLEGFLLELLVTLNLCLLLAISADRYLIIIHRKEKLNVRRARVIIVSAWSLSLLFAAPPLLGWGCFATFSSQRVCVRFVTRRASDVAYLVVSCLGTKLLPMAVVLYCYARIVSTVRKKNTKVHHYGVDVSVTHSSGSPPSGGPIHSVSKVSSTASGSAVRAAQCPGSQGPQSGNTVSFSSSTSVRFVSRDSSVRLHPAHCPALPLCLSDPVGSQVSSGCSLLGVTVTESVDSSFSPSIPSAVSNVRQPNDLTSCVPCRPDINDASSSELGGDEPAISKPRSKIFISIKHRPSEPSNCERDQGEPKLTGSGEADSKQAKDQTLSVSTCCTCSGTCTNFVLFEVQPRGPPHRTQCPCPQRPASHVHFESDHSLHGKPVRQCSSMTSGGCRSQGSRPYISSPSGFSSRRNAIRRTAGGRKQVVDMSFKTRAFKTILILSLLLCLCWSPFFIASMLTAMTSSSSSASPSSSSSSFSSTTSSTSSLTPSSSSSSSSPFSSLSFPSSSPCSSSAVASVVTSSSLMTPTTSSSLLSSSSSSFSSSSPFTSSFSRSPSSSSHSAQVLSVLLWLGFLKTALNPIVYALRIRKFREAFRLSATPGDCSCWAVGRACRPCPRWRDLLGKRRVNPSSRYQCG